MTKWTKKQQANHRAKWLKALRSGEYHRTSGVLTDGKGFCCLGVACEISGLGHWEGEEEWIYYAVGEDKVYQDLPGPVMEWLGFTHKLGRKWGYDKIIVAGKPYYDLADANDSGATFKQLAKAIEENIEALTS